MLHAVFYAPQCLEAMHLYALTLQRSTAINGAVYGNFSGAKVQEFAVARGRYLELLRVDESSLLQSVATTDVFGVIRSLKPFRLMGTSPVALPHVLPRLPCRLLPARAMF